MRNALCLFAAAATLAASVPAFAQNNTGGNAQCAGRSTNADGPRNQEFCFTDTDVRGDRNLATGATTNVGPRMHGPSLIRHRAHFVRQMLSSVENF